MMERLSEFIHFQKISVRQFEIKIGASDGMIRRAITNKTDIQSKWLYAISENYPNLNIEWLINGKGNMLRNESIQAPHSSAMNDPLTHYLKETITAKDSCIAGKDKYIEELNREIARLQTLLDIEKQAHKKEGVSASHSGRNDPAHVQTA